MMLYWYKTF